jgi:hypothetical protein
MCSRWDFALWRPYNKFMESIAVDNLRLCMCELHKNFVGGSPCSPSMCDVLSFLWHL